jgi:hypothetical protein
MMAPAAARHAWWTSSPRCATWLTATHLEARLQLRTVFGNLWFEASVPLHPHETAQAEVIARRASGRRLDA